MNRPALQFKTPLISAILLLLAAGSLSAGEDDSPRILHLSAALYQGVYYSHIPDYELKVFQYAARIQGELGFFIPRANLLISSTMGFDLVPPPASGDYFSFRGIWGGTSALSLEYLSPARQTASGGPLNPGMDRFSTGIYGGFDYYRYWNTHVLFITPEFGIFGSIPAFSSGTENRRIVGLIRPQLYIQLRRDTGLSIGGSAALVFRY